MTENDESRTEIEFGDPTPSNPAEARTPHGGAYRAATTYAKQANQAKGTQDPYSYDPTNELLDGDDSPSAEDLAARGVRVSDSGRSLVSLQDPTGLDVPPPAHANLELTKRAEKMAVAADEASGIDPQIGVKARAEARKAAGQERLKAAKAESGSAPVARSQPPSGRTGTPPASTTTDSAPGAGKSAAKK